MIDRENVIKGLEHCLHGEECCDDMECPYFIEHWSDSCCLEKCQKNLKADALAILKEQQEPVEIELEGGGSTWWYVCEDCHGAINDSDRYCRHCGRRLKRT